MSETRAADYVVVVDEDDTPIGSLRKEDVQSAEGVHFQTAHVFVHDSLGRILLQELAPGRPRNASKWGSSVAAYVRCGENYELAARRRLAEELELRVPITEIGTTVMPDFRGYKHVRLFSAHAADDAPQIGEPDHIFKLLWLAPSDINSSIASEPNAYTETFRWLWMTFYGDRPGRF